MQRPDSYAEQARPTGSACSAPAPPARRRSPRSARLICASCCGLGVPGDRQVVERNVAEIAADVSASRGWLETIADDVHRQLADPPCGRAGRPGNGRTSRPAAAPCARAPRGRSVQSRPKRRDLARRSRPRNGRDRPPPWANTTRMKKLAVPRRRTAAPRGCCRRAAASRGRHRGDDAGLVVAPQGQDVVGHFFTVWLSVRRSGLLRPSATVVQLDRKQAEKIAQIRRMKSLVRHRQRDRTEIRPRSSLIPSSPSQPGGRHAIPAILCGGSGSRLWPVSRKELRQAARPDPRRRLAVPAHARPARPATSSPNRS